MNAANNNKAEFRYSFFSATINAQSMETAVRKATRLEYQPSKRKHLQSRVRSVISGKSVLTIMCVCIQHLFQRRTETQ